MDLRKPQQLILPQFMEAMIRQGRDPLASLTDDQKAQLRNCLGDIESVEEVVRNDHGQIEVRFKVDEIQKTAHSNIRAGNLRFRYTVVETSRLKSKIVWHFGIIDERDIDDHHDKGTPRGISLTDANHISATFFEAIETLDIPGTAAEASQSPLWRDQYDYMLYFVPTERTGMVRDLINRRIRVAFGALR